MKLPRYMIAFDLETTGLDFNKAKIVTADIVEINTRTGETKTTSWVADPGVDLTGTFIERHGINNAFVQEKGRDHDTVVKEIVDHIYDAWDDGLPLVVYNAAFDLSLLHVLSDGKFNIRGTVIDPLVIDKATDRWRKGSRKLVDVAPHYGYNLSEEDAHSSRNDALATLHIAIEQLKGNIGNTDTIPDTEFELFAKQVQWRSTQHKSLAHYLESKGEEINGDGLWPISQGALDVLEIRRRNEFKTKKSKQRIGSGARKSYSGGYTSPRRSGGYSYGGGYYRNYADNYEIAEMMDEELYMSGADDIPF